MLVCFGCTAGVLSSATPKDAALMAAGDANRSDAPSPAIPHASSEPTVSIIPAPTHAVPAPGSFTVTSRTSLVAANGEPQRIARYFADLVARTQGASLALAKSANPGAIEFKLDPTGAPESIE